MHGVLSSLRTSLLYLVTIWEHSKSVDLVWGFFHSQDLQPAHLWKGKPGWTKFCQTWSAIAKLRSTSCAQGEIFSRMIRSWRRPCLRTARRSGRRRGNVTVTPTRYSPRDRGDTEASNDEDLGKEAISKLESFYVTVFVCFLCVFCMMAINILTLENVKWSAVDSKSLITFKVLRSVVNTKVTEVVVFSRGERVQTSPFCTFESLV